MRFERALNNVVNKLRRTAIDRRTELKRRAYHVSGDRVLSRLYAYALVRDCDGAVRAEIVPEEAAVVREVIHGFAEGLTVEAIKAGLDANGVRNRSKKPFSCGELRGLVRSVFCGRVKGPAGILVRSRVYQPIVSRKEWEKAAQNASKEVKNEDFWPWPDTRSDDLGACAAE